MMILWIRKNKAGKSKVAGQQDTASMQQHNDDMKRFSYSHPRLERTGSQDILTPEGDVLASVHEVRLALNCQN